ncbi:MAG: primosomal protein N' [SAR86 cluster bacterium]|uniref:Replication restart protein PriA n=1 Tax=SAR86 cluster bacterium TaxID=2030880 RepID=A0A2A4MHA7_9GAMM|nr:MAG: primosomal protein N' [SAR86 cluster bacterium]
MPNNKSNQPRQYLQLAVPSPFRTTLDYLAPQHISSEVIARLTPGIRVLVTLGRRKLIGILIRVHDRSSIDAKKLKPALEIIDTQPVFPPALLELLIWASQYYQHPIGEVMSAAMPAKLRGGASIIEQQQAWQLSPSGTDFDPASLVRAHQQKALFEQIKALQPLLYSDLKQKGFSSQTLRELHKKELIESISIDAESAAHSNTTTEAALTASPEQAQAIQSIGKSIGQFDCFLLDGVTGSGKTEVYMQAMTQALNQDLQCLILVPEIGLTPQTIDRFKKRFNCPIVAIHSGLSDTERLQAWRQARNGSAKIIIGTRSAVFTPLQEIGLIIIDEEHDGSFKQQDGFKYSARDLAVMRAQRQHCTIVLGSATPSLESLHNAAANKFTHLRLRQRAGKAIAPKISLIDVANEQLEGGFSKQLLTNIDIQLSLGNQVLVFINRRGFAPVLNCENCGWVAECNHCDIQLTVHKHPKALKCHHCGINSHIPASCPYCNNKQLNTVGVGTQKSEQLLNEKFPQYPVIRIDRDSTRNKQSLERLIAQVNIGEPCILVGTQMLAKGHHFPNITLVAILDADSGLFSADFRGQEQMAQTLVQVSGRAGRASKLGEVLIQTRHSDHASVQAILKSMTENNYGDFAKLMLAERHAANMPPFSHMVLIKAEAQYVELALGFLNEVAALMGETISQTGLTSIQYHGPLPSPMEKRAGRYRVHISIIGDSRARLQTLLNHIAPIAQQFKSARKVRWSIDVDPQDLL